MGFEWQQFRCPSCGYTVGSTLFIETDRIPDRCPSCGIRFSGESVQQASDSIRSEAKRREAARQEREAARQESERRRRTRILGVTLADIGDGERTGICIGLGLLGAFAGALVSFAGSAARV